MPLDRENFFRDAFGVSDEHYYSTQNFLMQVLEQNQSKFILSSGKTLEIGSFSTPTLSESEAELRTLIGGCIFPNKTVSGENIIGDIEELHMLHISSGGVIMSASQFNTLEHVNPVWGPIMGAKPYRGMEPNCAMSAVAGFAYRNFCVRFKDGIVSSEPYYQIGQTNDNQINCFITVQKLIIEKAKELRIESPDRKTSRSIYSSETIPDGDFFVFNNGHIESTKGNLEALNTLLERGGNNFKQQLKNALRVGIHRDTEITLRNDKKLVTQVYASAIDINYSDLGYDVTEDERKQLWEPLAKIVLEGAYEHTLLEGLKNNAKKILAGKPTEPILLTQFGGDAFKNDPKWIKEAMAFAIKKAGSYGVPFDVKLVHHQTIDPVYNDGFLERVIAKDPIVEGNIKLLTENIKPSINNVTVEHEKKGAENQYRLIFKNAEDTIRAYGLLLRKYNIAPEAKEKEKEGEFVIVLNDRNVEQFKNIILQQQSHSVWGGAAIASVSGGLSNLAGGVPAASSFGGGAGHRSAGAFDVDASLSFGGGTTATASFVGFEASRARLVPDARSHSSTSFFGAGAGADGVATASISFDEPRAGLGSRDAVNRSADAIALGFGDGTGLGGGGSASVDEFPPASFGFGGMGGIGNRMAIPETPIQPPAPARSPSPEVKTSDCFSCIRGIFEGKARR